MSEVLADLETDQTERNKMFGLIDIIIISLHTQNNIGIS